MKKQSNTPTGANKRAHRTHMALYNRIRQLTKSSGTAMVEYRLEKGTEKMK